MIDIFTSEDMENVEENVEKKMWRKIRSGGGGRKTILQSYHISMLNMIHLPFFIIYLLKGTFLKNCKLFYSQHLLRKQRAFCHRRKGTFVSSENLGA